MSKSNVVYHEPARDIPIIGEYDVIVAGGGPAGCAAALSSARHGAKTLLLEKDGYLGGATVSQLVCVVLSTNGVDCQGVWHELMHVLKRRGGVSEIGRPSPFSIKHWDNDYWISGTVVPEVVKYAWDELLSVARVSLLHHVLVAGTSVEDGKITGVLVETKAGRQAIRGLRVIDCTGDGVVADRAGVTWDLGDSKSKYAMGCNKNLLLGNVYERGYHLTDEQLAMIDQRRKEAVERGEYTSPYITLGSVMARLRGIGHMMADRPEAVIMSSRIVNVDPLDPFDVTRAEREGREHARQVADFFKRYVPGQEQVYLASTSNHVGVRSSRRIRGIAAVTARDVFEFRKYPDGVARGSWEVDVHPHDVYIGKAATDTTQSNPSVDRLKAGDYYDIRYGCLVAQGIDNLMMAGRCLSAEFAAQGSLRIQQTCMSTGQAAGTAAALSLQGRISPRELDPLKVIAQLEKDRNAIEPAFDLFKSLPQVQR
jgi:hypothetical protein